jgi:hypothetical protein
MKEGSANERKYTRIKSGREEREFGRIPGFAGNRAIRGSAIAPAPALCAGAAPHPSYPLRGGGVGKLVVTYDGRKLVESEVKRLGGVFYNGNQYNL